MVRRVDYNPRFGNSTYGHNLPKPKVFGGRFSFMPKAVGKQGGARSSGVRPANVTGVVAVSRP